MNDITRHPLKTRNRRLRRRLPALIAVVAAVTAGIALWTDQPDVPPPPTDNAPRQSVLFSAERDSLLSFTINPSAGEAYTVCLTENGFAVADHPAYPLVESDVEQMIEGVLLVEAVETVGHADKVEGGLAMIGLQPPEMSLTAEFAGGTTLSLLFGSRAPSDIPTDYLMMGGSNMVYTVPSSLRTQLDRGLNTLHPVPDIAVPPDTLLSVSFAGVAPYAFTLGKNGEDPLAITAPHPSPISKDSASAFLRSAGAMRLAQFVRYANRYDGLDEYGLNSASPFVIFVYTDPHMPGGTNTLQLLLGSNISQIGFYCLYDGAVYKASHLSMGFLYNKKATDFAGKLLDIPVDSLSRVAFTSPSGSTEYALSHTERILPNNEVALDEAGMPVFDLSVTKDGSPYDNELFLVFYNKLLALSPAGAYPEPRLPTGQPLIRLEITAGDIDRNIAFYADGPLHAAAAVDGTALVYVALLDLAALFPDIALI